ncbi:hypothetical protein KK141_10320 [Dyella sp. LX-66]|uniref:HlyD family secretion protein n=1 Tax=unclassified Dyella TaxID=2634549 RepID=UPI001BE005CE|nr:MULTISPECIES: HlyD family secretion protein [unclassified Dyella]MBT2116996.1 hypothetical protein [Dyella sp. LX-1]MBT2139928.1 hypothetical protein [Dyella sp. LX-66]
MQQLQPRRPPAKRHQLKRLQLRRNQLERLQHKKRQHRIQLLQQQRTQLLARLAQLIIDILRSGLQWQLAWEGAPRPAPKSVARRATIVRAPVSGVVASVLPRECLQDVQLTGAPAASASRLLAELWVDKPSLDFMRKGAVVVIRYRAFPHQRFGRYSGRVLSRSLLAISANRATRLLGRPTDGPRFRVRVWLDQHSSIIDGRTEPLIPGMTLDADILLERQQLAES